MIDMGCAIQLWQMCTGLDGHKLVNGTVIQGTEQAARDEMAGTWTKMQGQDGDKMRTKMRKLRDVVRQSADSGGVRQGLQNLHDLALSFAEH